MCDFDDRNRKITRPSWNIVRWLWDYQVIAAHLASSFAESFVDDIKSWCMDVNE
jgi:hypothetical protein